MTQYPPAHLPVTKAEWRAWAFARREQVVTPPADAVVQHLRPFFHKRDLVRILGYHAMPGEPDVGALRGQCELFTTRTRYKPVRHLTIHPWESATELSKFGYLQPPADAPQIDLADVEVILLPGVAFDRSGVRLGYGGGFYDRLLPKFKGLTIGVTWQDFVVDTLPREPHDCPVDWVVTEAGLVQVGH